jgi:Skp family chaperone for outer membrane proteins
LLVKEKNRLEEENQKKENELKRKIERLKTEKERKERTKRLIEIGAMIESIAGGELDLYKFQSYLNQYKLAISALKKQRRN